MNYKINVMYDGRGYNGWQKQGNTDKTIQGKIEALLQKLEGYEVEIHGAGRTDAGVHAIGQVFNVKLTTEWDVKELKKVINLYLPADIAITEVELVDDRFHARLSAVRKTYRYRIYIGDSKKVFDRYYVYHYEGELNIEKMKEAAKILCGTHDFKSFCANKRMKKSTVRTVESINIYLKNDELIIDYTGDGFLYNMVRILTGTLIEIGEGKKKVEDVRGIIDGRDRMLAGPTAPPQGLTLVNVEY